MSEPWRPRRFRLKPTSPALKTHKELPAIQAKLKANANDPETNAKMAGVCAARGQIEKAESHLAKASKSGCKGAALSPAYKAVGDHYQTGEQFPKAIACFQKGDSTATNPTDRAYALVSIMSCHLSTDDTKAAKAVAKTLAALRGAPAKYVKMAQDVLKG